MRFAARWFAMALALTALASVELAVAAPSDTRCAGDELASSGDDCADGSSDCSDCAADCLCVCCPLRVVAHTSNASQPFSVVAEPSFTRSATADPVLAFVASDIFQPPRA